MKRAYPEVYEVIQTNPNVDYKQVFSEPRKNGLRRIKFWMVGINKNVDKMQALEQVLTELADQPGVKFAGYNVYSYGRTEGWAVGRKRLPFPRGNFIEVWVE